MADKSLADLFNEYQLSFLRATEPCNFNIDFTTGGIRFRLFGRDEDKQAAWKAEHPDCGPIFFVCLSSNPIEIWGDLRMAQGHPVINPLCLGHEVIHALRVAMSGWTLRNEDEGDLLSPDKYREVKP